MKLKSQIQLLRHATLIITMNGFKILVDPMLSEKDAMDPVQNCGNETRIPMVDLPIDKAALAELLKEIDAVLVTHTHRDHWDIAAQQLIDKDKIIFCQPADFEKIKGQGFANVRSIDSTMEWEGITLHRTSGKHGTGEIGQKMGEVSGFVLNNKHESIYVAGDTIWCEDVEKALASFKPETTILNAGGARFLTGDPITMTPGDVLKVYQAMPTTKIVAVHMDTVNHCFVTRQYLAKALADHPLKPEIQILKDGESILT